ncbi:hypothetical protein CHUAL_013213 [Chamberlinius hualienensis]
MQSKPKPPVPPKPCHLQLSYHPPGSQLKRNKEPPPTLPKPRRLLSTDDQSHTHRLLTFLNVLRFQLIHSGSTLNLL